MPRPRQPLLKAIISGAAAADPARYRDRANFKLPPVGPAPAWLDSGQREAWDLFIRELPWLSSADRAILEVAARLRARLIYEPNPPVQVLNLLRQCLGQLCASPADRNRIAPPAEPVDDSEQHFRA